jgi:formamidopyrimidine-DNA glycosylase
MPELPEVEITRRKLEVLVSKDLQGFWTDTTKNIYSSLSPAEIAEDIFERKIIGIERIGKVIFFPLGVARGIATALKEFAHEERLLAFHQRMSGSFLIINPASDLPQKTPNSSDKYVHTKLFFIDGTELWFRDPRKFGTVWYGLPEVVQEHAYLKRLGPDALDLTFEDFTEALLPYSGTIKPLLLRQDILAGIGNIVVDEMLWHSKIHPKTRLETLSSDELGRLYTWLQHVLQTSIAAKGSTLKDWSHPDGDSGSFQTIMKVYGRKGDPCERCKTAIVRIVVGSRGTWICPECQILTF